MRATFHCACLALLAFACQPPACRAQTAEPGKAGAAQTAQGGSKNDDSLSPSTLPKVRQSVKEQPGNGAYQHAQPRRGAASRAHPRAGRTPPPSGRSPRLGHRTTRARRFLPSKHSNAPKQAIRAQGIQGSIRAQDHGCARGKAGAAGQSRVGDACGRRADQGSRPAGMRPCRWSHHDRHARTGTLAISDQRRARPSRRAFVEESPSREDRRVGDVIPPGVALYPLRVGVMVGPAATARHRCRIPRCGRRGRTVRPAAVSWSRSSAHAGWPASGRSYPPPAAFTAHLGRPNESSRRSAPRLRGSRYASTIPIHSALTIRDRLAGKSSAQRVERRHRRLDGGELRAVVERAALHVEIRLHRRGQPPAHRHLGHDERLTFASALQRALSSSSGKFGFAAKTGAMSTFSR